MADNKPTSWPPAPHNSDPAKSSATTAGKAGRVSVTLAIGGWLFLLLVWLAFIAPEYLSGRLSIWTSSARDILWAGSIIWLPALIAVFAVGLVFGITDRRSVAGKVGIALSISFSVLLVCSFVYLMWVAQRRPDLWG